MFGDLWRSRRFRRIAARVRPALAYACITLLLLATAITLLVLVLRVPHWQSLIQSIHDPKDRVNAENEVIKNILQIVGGAFFLLGVYFTWRNLRVAQEGQITQRFNDAIEHLGSEKAEVKLGGIYALARIARDSSRDHQAVMQVFCSYVRETTKRAKWEPVAPEVQAILTMIGRRTVEHETEDDLIDLRDAFLPGVNLRGAQLERVRLDGANLSRANFESALLSGASFAGATLEDTYLRHADLRDCNLTAANLRHATLRGARLDGANIFGAQMDGCSLMRTDLSGVRNAIRQQVDSALTDETTTPPAFTDFVQVSLGRE